MILFRLVAPRNASNDQIVSGEGAKRSGGRWNRIGVSTVYTGLVEEVTYCEQASYSLIARIEDDLRIGRHIPSSMRPELVDVARVLARVEVDLAESEIADISSAVALNQAAKNHDISITFEMAIHPIRTSVQQRTQQLADRLRLNGVSALITKSARSTGNCVVIFSDALRTPLRLVERIPIRLSCVTSEDQKLPIGKRIQPLPARFMVEREMPTGWVSLGLFDVHP